MCFYLSNIRAKNSWFVLFYFFSNLHFGLITFHRFPKICLISKQSKTGTLENKIESSANNKWLNQGSTSEHSLWAPIRFSLMNHRGECFCALNKQISEKWTILSKPSTWDNMPYRSSIFIDFEGSRGSTCQNQTHPATKKPHFSITLSSSPFNSITGLTHVKLKSHKTRPLVIPHAQ